MKIILDCNVVIAAGLTDGICREVLVYTLEKENLLISEDIVEEYARVTKREKFRSYWHHLQQLLLAICELGHFVKSTQCSYRLPDLDDEKYLAAAEAGQAAFLITGNKKHFPEKAYGNTEILTPTDFHRKFIT